MVYIYLDDAATTRVDKRIRKAIIDFMSHEYGNPSSLHRKGKNANKHVSNARKKTADLINAESDEIIFTSGGTESDNLAIKGVMEKNDGNHIITTKIEHPAVYETCKFLEKNGYDVTFLDVDKDGFVDPSDFEDSIRDDTVIASIMYANNEIGTIEPIQELGKIAHDNDVLLHTDAVQAIGKTPIDVRKENIDLLTLSGHKFHGPKGIGVLYLSTEIDIQPIVHGGGHENGYRSGTENVPGIVGIGKACEIIKKEINEDIEKMKTCRDRLVEGILNNIDNCYLNGPRKNRLPNNANFTFEDVNSEALVLQLDSRCNIGVSTGSACSVKDNEPSRVLTALGLDEEAANSSLRLSLSRFTKKKEIDKTIEVLPEVVSNLRDMRGL